MVSKKAVIIVPTYNEKENISRLIPTLLDIFEKIKNWEMHLLVVDDSSPDDTAQLVREWSGKSKFVHLHSNPVKAGLGKAYLSGMKTAFGTLGADVVFEFDADFSHDPTKIPEFLKKLDEGSDMVLGSRYIKGGGIPMDWGFDRKLLSVLGNLFIVLVFTNFSIRDWTGGYRAIRKRVYQAVVNEMSDPKFSGYTFQVGFLRKAVLKGFGVSEVPFKFVDRKLGKSKMGSETILRTLQYVLATRISEIVSSHFFKFALVGGIGFVITSTGSFAFAALPTIRNMSANLVSATGWGFLNPSFLSTMLATECAIVSNFILNNFFTFADRKVVNAGNLLPKFLQFNGGSLGAVVISSVVVGVGTSISGEQATSKMFWLVVATALSMIVNYLVYSKIIWKSPHRRSAKKAEK